MIVTLLIISIFLLSGKRWLVYLILYCFNTTFFVYNPSHYLYNIFWN